jgi:hypothetical protein
MDAENGTIKASPAAVEPFGSMSEGEHMTRKPPVTAEGFQWSDLDVKTFCDWRDCQFSVALDWAMDTDHVTAADHKEWNQQVIRLMHGLLKSEEKENGEEKITINQDTLSDAAILTGVIPVWAGTIQAIVTKWPHLKDVLLGEEMGKKEGEELTEALKSWCFTVRFIPDWDDLIVLMLVVLVSLFHPRLG